MRCANTLRPRIIAQTLGDTLADTSLQWLRAVRDKFPALLSADNPQYTDCRIALKMRFLAAPGFPSLTQRLVAPCPFPAIFSTALPTLADCGRYRSGDASSASGQAAVYS